MPQCWPVFYMGLTLLHELSKIALRTHLSQEIDGNLRHSTVFHFLYLWVETGDFRP